MIKSHKFIFIFLLLSLYSSLLYAEEEKYEAKLIKKIYSFGTASINGTYYPFGNAISRLFSKNLKRLVTVAEPTPGSVANVNFLRKKQIELALIQSDVAWMAYQGTVIFNGNPFKDLRVLASLYSEKVQIVVRADSGINTLDDLRGKRISVGEIESGSAAGAIQILEAAGLKNKEDYDLVNERFTKATELLLDGYIDAVYYVGGVPADGLIRLSEKIPIKLLEIPETVINKLTIAFPYYSKESIDTNSYLGHKKSIKTLGFKALLVGTTRLPSEEVINILTVIYSNPKILSDDNKVLVELNKSEAIKGVDAEMLHDGAAAFFMSQPNK